MQRLRTHMTSGEWPVGSKLPGETTLARQLGVGRSTMRQALRALAGAGMVEALYVPKTSSVQLRRRVGTR